MSVDNSTMTITTLLLLLLLATGIVAVTAVDDCPNQNAAIKNCCDLRLFTFAKGTKESSGIHLVSIPCNNKSILADAYCDNCIGGGGWLVVQRRQDGSVDFNRDWTEYEDGFGKLTGELWYGLKALHCLTGQSGWEMRMDIKLDNGTNIFLQYKQFKVASAKDKYKLTVGGFQGTTTDPMAYHNGMYFTTKDRDNDPWSGRNCATDNYKKSTGGWWYNQCKHIQPNLLYKYNPGVLLNGKYHPLPFIEIKIRPHNCNI